MSQTGACKQDGRKESPHYCCVAVTAFGVQRACVCFALPPGNFTSFTDTGSQLIFAAQAAHYQDPFLASITPPAEHYS